MKRKGTQQDTIATTISTPLGRVRIAATERGICRMDFAEKMEARANSTAIAASSAATRQARAHLERAAAQLQEYFAGRRREFDLPLDLRGTPHQQRVWKSLLEIPYGKTLSYGELARRIGSPRAARAVGTACGQNPVGLVVPCHRVIGGDGGLHGYGGGLWRKQKLLEIEGAVTPELKARAASS